MGMKIGSLTFNGVTARSLGVFVSGAGAYNAAAYDFTPYKVPGKNGDLIISNGRFKNIKVAYPAFIPNAFPEKVQDVRDWLRSAKTYQKIQDNYDEDHYRMGFGVDALEFAPARDTGANFQIIFECRPERFLTSGETAVTVVNNSRLTNPTQYEAKPLIQLTGITSSASIKIGGVSLTATRAYSGTVTVDCELMDIYSGSTNLNDLFSGDFPTLKTGTNTVTISGITTVKITPRWWEL